MLLGTRMTNNEPSAITDLDVVARYDATDPNYVVKDSSNRISALLDKSKRLAGIEKVTNVADREFTSDTGFWTKSQYFTISNGVMKMTNAPRGEGFYKSSMLTIGKVYKITFDILNTVSSSFIYMPSFGTDKTFGGNGSKTFVGVATATGFGLFGANVSPTNTLDIDNVSVIELTGNHITQTDITKMPIHTNRYNLLTYSEDFSNSIWAKQTTTIVPNQTIAPNGSMTASLIYPNTSGTYRGLRQTGNLKDTLSLSIYAKAQNKNLLSFFLHDSKRIMFDLISGEKVYDTSVGVNSIIESVGNNWFRISLTYNKSVDATNNIYIFITDDNTTSITANGTDGIYIWGAQLEQSNFAGKYQRINAANDYDTNGFEYYAQFDGVDDYLKSLPFTLNQPTSIYSCLKQVSFTNEDYIYDGHDVNVMSLRQFANAGNLRMSTTIGITNSTKNTIGTFDNIYTLFNSVNSKIKTNNGIVFNGDVGLGNGRGFTLGSHSYNINFANIAVKEIIIKRIATDESDTIFNYFKKKHNVQY